MGGRSTDPWADHIKIAPQINRESIEQALSGFPLQSTRDYGWIAAACREAAFLTVGQNYEDYPGTQGVRRELDTIVASIERVKQELAGRSVWAESTLRRYAVIQDGCIENNEIRTSRTLLQNALADWHGAGSELCKRQSRKFRELHKAIDGLDYIAAFIRSANERLNAKDSPGRWKDVERRKERIAFAIYLSKVFNLAFDKSPTVNNWTDDDGNPKLGLWPDFYGRVACVVFQTYRIPDMVAILKEARRQQKHEGVFSHDNFLDQLLP